MSTRTEKRANIIVRALARIFQPVIAEATQREKLNRTSRLHDISTHTLVRKLRTRKGVETAFHTSGHEDTTILAKGSCLILRVSDIPLPRPNRDRGEAV